jgi:hypothetical protein
MVIVQVVSPVDKSGVEPIVPGLIAAYQQYCSPSRIKGVEDAKGASPALDSQLAHIAMTRTVYV